MIFVCQKLAVINVADAFPEKDELVAILSVPSEFKIFQSFCINFNTCM